MKKSPFILIFGGADMTGKTNVIAALSYALKVPSFKASSERDTFVSKQDLFLNQLRYAAPREVDLIAQGCIPAIIFDRSYVCEWVYAKLYGRETDMKVLRHIDDMMSEFDAKIIINYRSSYEGFEDDLDMNLKAPQLAHIESLYRDFATWTKCSTYFLNVDDENIIRECTDVLTLLGYTGDKLFDLIDEVREYDALVRSGTMACCV